MKRFTAALSNLTRPWIRRLFVKEFQAVWPATAKARRPYVLAETVTLYDQKTSTG